MNATISSKALSYTAHFEKHDAYMVNHDIIDWDVDTYEAILSTDDEISTRKPSHNAVMSFVTSNLFSFQCMYFLTGDA